MLLCIPNGWWYAWPGITAQVKRVKHVKQQCWNLKPPMITMFTRDLLDIYIPHIYQLLTYIKIYPHTYITSLPCLHMLRFKDHLGHPGWGRSQRPCAAGYNTFKLRFASAQRGGFAGDGYKIHCQRQLRGCCCLICSDAGSVRSFREHFVSWPGFWGDPGSSVDSLLNIQVMFGCFWMMKFGSSQQTKLAC